MSPVSLRRSHLRVVLLCTAPLLWWGCGGGGGTDIVLPSLSVSTSTQGVELDPDGYSLVIDAGAAQPLGLSATVVVDRLTDGDHTIELSGLAANCSAQGENPRTITVRSGSTTTAAFQVTCTATVGAIEVSTTTSGSGSDPDGYTVMVDGAERGPVAGSGTAGIGSVAAGSHSVGLSGLAGNCQVAGDNPRTITVSPSQTAQVPFSISCTVPGPTMGTLEITTTTTGANQDADGYTVAVDGGASQPIAASSSLTLTNVATGARRVELGGIASNCSVSGGNPRNATVTAGQTTRVAFAIACVASPPPPAETGQLRVTVATTGGSPDPDGYSVALDGGAALSLTINGNRTFPDLTPGAHTVQLSGLAGNCTLAGDNPRNVAVTAGATAAVAFEVSCAAAGPSINLRVERMYLTQSTQRLAGDVPLVQGRDGFVRVFATANGPNSARPAVRVRLYRNGALAQTYTVTARSSGTPTSVQQDGLSNSWNVAVPGSLIGAGTALLADVDPSNEIAETSETDNSFPASGTPVSLTVQSAAPAAIRLVPILQTANGLQGSADNSAQLTSLVRRIYPLSDISTDVRAVFTAAGPLQFDDRNGQWGQILTDLEALRVADNATDRTYYGLVRLDYGAGIIGNGFVGAPSAIGTDQPAEAARVLAHELGHTWGELHTPCGNPPGVDRGYPYPSGNIGVYGYDAAGSTIKSPALPDIMGYCDNPWISDYIYERVMSYRRANPMTAAAVAVPGPSLLVWGRIENGRPVLEPALQVVARPHLPRMRGPYSLEGTAADGSVLFSFSFDAIQSADDPRGSRHFAFAIPLEQAGLDRLQKLRLSSPGALAATVSRPVAQAQKATPDVAVAREAGGVRLRWNASAHPVILVRDPDTGEVLSFARGGDARVETTKSTVDLNLSDGVRSQRLRRAISR